MLSALGFIQLDPEIQEYVTELLLRIAVFLVGAVCSLFIGRPLIAFIDLVLQLLPGLQDRDLRQRLLTPYQSALALTATFSFLGVWLLWLLKYDDLYTFLGFFIYFALSASIVWLATSVARRILRRSLIGLMQRWIGEVNEVVLVIETLIYFLIALLAVIIFTVGLRLNLSALIASLGVSGVVFAFAGQQALGRLVGTLELYLDRPYLPGEYIRVSFNPYKEDVYGRVESIGLRSTKIRMVARNTLIVVPNSVMAGMYVENVSRGKKIMAMLCLDFFRPLQEGEQALVRRVVEETSHASWGLEQASLRIHFSTQETSLKTRARISFFITGSSRNSLGLRRRLLELANESVAKKLAAYNLLFSVPEPMVYIDSPMSI